MKPPYSTVWQATGVEEPLKVVEIVGQHTFEFGVQSAFEIGG